MGQNDRTILTCYFYLKWRQTIFNIQLFLKLSRVVPRFTQWGHSAPKEISHCWWMLSCRIMLRNTVNSHCIDIAYSNILHQAKILFHKQTFFYNVTVKILKADRKKLDAAGPFEGNINYWQPTMDTMNIFTEDSISDIKLAPLLSVLTDTDLISNANQSNLIYWKPKFVQNTTF